MAIVGMYVYTATNSGTPPRCWHALSELAHSPPPTRAPYSTTSFIVPCSHKSF
ncbi:hypothetical protein LZ32DRAFT_598885 [Colletotrichum eremochloae]|nr:hypothetical protein LZ32DRAFT_598885 [Colletotrichum eremochloae]